MKPHIPQADWLLWLALAILLVSAVLICGGCSAPSPSEPVYPGPANVDDLTSRPITWY